MGEARTRDPQLGKLMLYQLSYYRNRFDKEDLSVKKLFEDYHPWHLPSLSCKITCFFAIIQLFLSYF